MFFITAINSALLSTLFCLNKNFRSRAPIDHHHLLHLSTHLVLAAVFVSNLPVASAKVRPKELDALLFLYDEAGGANWTERENWDPANDCCRKTRQRRPYRLHDEAAVAWTEDFFEATPFTGVGCLDPCDDYLDGPGCTAGRIVSLRLRDNNLVGSIDGWTDIGEMRNLSYLDLSYNANLTGSLPTELGLINNLEIFQMRDCGLTGNLPAEIADVNGNGYGALAEVALAKNYNLEGFLPPSFTAHAASLMMLDLGYNALSGTLPSSYSNLHRLQVFYLRNNSMSGTIPQQFGSGGGLHDLRYFELQGGTNKFSGTLPTNMGGLKNLITLDLSGLHLSGTLPTELGRLSTLDTLKLNDNSFSGSIPTQLGKLQQLEILDLYKNEFLGDMPSELGLLLNLKQLYLPNEQLLPLRMRYCQQRLPSLGKYNYRIVREEYYKMISSICPEPFDTLSAFATLDMISGDV